MSVTDSVEVGAMTALELHIFIPYQRIEDRRASQIVYGDRDEIAGCARIEIRRQESRRLIL